MRKLFEKLKRINVNEKSGFRNAGTSPIILLDERGETFYDTSKLTRKVQNFNLPAGVYYVQSGKFVKTPSPVDYPVAILPKPERIMRANPENFDIHFGENPFTGTVFFDARAIYLDNSLQNLPLCDLVFVLYHEYGHRYYETESYCDMYARNRMIADGYNPSQIGEGIVHTLSAKNFPRMLKVVNSFI